MILKEKEVFFWTLKAGGSAFNFCLLLGTTIAGYFHTRG